MTDAEPMKKKPATDPSPGSWEARKERFVSVQLPRDLGRMVKVVADDEEKSMGELLDEISREIVAGKFRLILERLAPKAKPTDQRRTG